jgi:hypothetical protein
MSLFLFLTTREMASLTPAMTWHRHNERDQRAKPLGREIFRMLLEHP